MVFHQSNDAPLAPELEAIATAAADVLRAQADEAATDTTEMQARVREAASAAITAGAELDAIADAQRIGRDRARQQLGKDVLRAVARAAKNKREADTAYEQAIQRAGRLGLSHREIAAEAQVSHGTIRAILARRATRDSDAGTPLVNGATDDNGVESPQM